MTESAPMLSVVPLASVLLPTAKSPVMVPAPATCSALSFSCTACTRVASANSTCTLPVPTAMP